MTKIYDKGEVLKKDPAVSIDGIIGILKHCNFPSFYPCVSTSSDTDVHHFDIALNHFSPSHLKKDIPSNISQVRTLSTTNK
jgi:hypothetical protein